MHPGSRDRDLQVSLRSKEDLGLTQGPEEGQAAAGMLHRTGLALTSG